MYEFNSQVKPTMPSPPGPGPHFKTPMSTSRIGVGGDFLLVLNKIIRVEQPGRSQAAKKKLYTI